MSIYYEFFAGGGMARAGLGPAWSCSFANDFSSKKASSYIANWGDKEMKVDSIANITLGDLPGQADLAWASFPCQDLSLAGARAGLDGNRSGTFWAFQGLMQKLTQAHRAPKIIALENVVGLLTASGGKDFTALANSLVELNYRLGAVVIDAAHFVPQSRPRLFVIATAADVAIPEGLVRTDPSALWHTRALVDLKFNLPKSVQNNWIWWNLPAPPVREQVFADLIEENPTGVQWNSRAETQALLEMMSPVNRDKVRVAMRAGTRQVGALYKRTRNGVQRAEVRFDDIAGCLRTPSGGSSRQSILVIEGRSVRSRLLSPRELARLMGLADAYVLPSKYNDAYHLLGDGLVVPVISYLAQNLLSPIAETAQQTPQREVA